MKDGAKQDVARSSLFSLSTHQVGVLISLLGIVWVSPDSVLIRYAEREHSGVGCVVFYKYVFKFAATITGLLVVYGGPRGFLLQVLASKRHFWLAAILEALCEAGFTLSIQHTTAANTLVFLNINPLWCAIFGFLFLAEKPNLRTIIAIALGFGCVALVFIGKTSDSPSGRETLFGDFLSLATGMVLALYLTVCRHAGKLYPKASLVPASAAGAGLSMLIGLALAQGHVGSECAPVSGASGWIYIVVNGAVVMPVALACFALGPKYILSAEVGLIMLLEVLLGPLWVWLTLGEVPATWTLIGGGLLLFVLASHESLSLIAERRKPVDEVVANTIKGVASEEPKSAFVSTIAPAPEEAEMPSDACIIEL